jgi:hypothetical protein
VYDFEFNFVLKKSAESTTVGARPRYKIFSPTETLQSWLRILLETGMSVLFSSVFVLSCVGRGFVAG